MPQPPKKLLDQARVCCASPMLHKGGTFRVPDRQRSPSKEGGRSIPGKRSRPLRCLSQRLLTGELERAARALSNSPTRRWPLKSKGFCSVSTPPRLFYRAT